MIIEFLMGVGIGIANLILQFFPTYQESAPISDAITNLFVWLGQANSILPISQLLVAVSLVLFAEAVIFVVRGVEWGLSKVWPTGQMKLF